MKSLKCSKSSKNIKSSKVQSLKKIFLKVWKSKNFQKIKPIRLCKAHKIMQDYSRMFHCEAFDHFNIQKANNKYQNQ